MTKPVDPAADLELELARKLLGLAGDQQEINGIPDSIADQLSPRELEEFSQAQECLRLLQIAAPAAAHVNAEDQSTARGETIAESNASTPFGLPSKLGRFEVIRELGRGGFGIVLLAWDPALERNVALKIPRTDRFLNSDLQKRFEREARAAAVLSHPSIVPIFETDRLGPISYIAFEYCEGESLAQFLHNRPQPTAPLLAAEIIKRLADAVQHAHSRGVIHRDLKPANILIAKRENEFRNGADKPSDLASSLRITDFGLARIEYETDSLTNEGAIIGTPAYIAPELANGDSQTGASVDIYSLGVILYQLLTGELPFEGKTHLSTLKQIVESPASSPRLINKSIPKDLSAVCLKCLQKRPQQRYSTCQELSDDLDRSLNGRPVVARETTWLESTRCWCRRNPLLAASLSSLIAVLTTSTIVMSLLWMNMAEAWKVSSYHEGQSEIRAEQALKQTRRLRSAINNLLTAVADEPSIKSKDMEQFRKKLLVSATEFYNELRADVPEDEELLREYLQSLKLLAQVHQQLDDHAKSIEICEEALSLMELLEHHSDVALELEFKQILAFCLRATGEFGAAESIQSSAIELAFESTIAHPESVLAALMLAEQTNDQARGFLLKKDFRRAELLNNQAVALVEKTTGSKLRNLPASEANFNLIRTRADIYSRTGRAQAGIKLAELASSMFDSLDCANDEKSTNLLNARASLSFILGVANSNAGNYPASGEHFDNAIQVLDVLCDRHADVGRYFRSRLGYQHSRALIHYHENQLDDAETILDSIVAAAPDVAARFPQTKNETWLYCVKAQELLQAIYRGTDRPEESRRCLLAAIKTCEDLTDANQVNYQLTATKGNLYYHLGMLDAKLNRHESAQENYLRAVKILEPIASQQSAGEAVSRLHNAYLGVMTAADARKDYELAIRFGDRFLLEAPYDDTRRIVVRRSYATWLGWTGDYQKSHELLVEITADCRLPEDYYELSRSTAICFAALEQNADDVSPDQRQRLKDALIETLVELLRQSATKGSSSPTAARIREESDFESVRNEPAFKDFLQTFAE